MYPSVINVVPQDDFSLLVAFDNGEEGICDLKQYLGLGVFKQIQDPEQFKRVHVAFDTIEWECGVDLDPEFVHSHCKITTRQ